MIMTHFNLKSISVMSHCISLLFFSWKRLQNPNLFEWNYFSPYLSLLEFLKSIFHQKNFCTWLWVLQNDKINWGHTNHCVWMASQARSRAGITSCSCESLDHYIYAKNIFFLLLNCIIFLFWLLFTILDALKHVWFIFSWFSTLYKRVAAESQWPGVEIWAYYVYHSATDM